MEIITFVEELPAAISRHTAFLHIAVIPKNVVVLFDTSRHIVSGEQMLAAQYDPEGR